MEEICYIMLIAACAAFIIKTIVSFIETVNHKIDYKISEAECEARRESWRAASIGRLEEKVEALEEEKKSNIDF